jgi:hypothetical protein
MEENTDIPLAPFHRRPDTNEWRQVVSGEIPELFTEKRQKFWVVKIELRPGSREQYRELPVELAGRLD